MVGDSPGGELPRFLCYTPNMEMNLHNSGTLSSDMGSIALPTWRQDTYLVLNPLTPSELEWLRQQSMHVAEVFRQSMSERTAAEQN